MSEEKGSSDGGARKEPSALKNFLSGGVGGMCTVITGHPLDTIKVYGRRSRHPTPTLSLSLSLSVKLIDPSLCLSSISLVLG